MPIPLKLDIFEQTPVDLNMDGKKEWIIYVKHMYQCVGWDLKNCRIYVMKRDKVGDWIMIAYPYSEPKIWILPSSTQGYSDLLIGNKKYIYNGRSYIIK